MADRIDIEIVDRVAPTISRKILAIAANSERANTALEKLKRNLGALRGSNVTQLVRASNSASAALQKQAIAHSKVQQAQSRAGIASAQLSAAQSRGAAAAARAATAQQTLASATSRAQRSAIQAQAASARYTAQLQRQSAAAQRASRSGGNSELAGAAGGVGVGLAGAVILRDADAYLKYEQRIQSVTDTEKERLDVQKQMFEISNRTYAQLDTTALLYQRFAPTAQRLGKDMNDVYDVIENLNRAMALSGATTQEADGALRQLGQAFAANRLSGQELNSVLEQLPLVARVIADQVGVNIGQLRQFANEGKVTADELFDAFTKSGKGVGELTERFARLNPTISQTAQVFRNNFIFATGELFKTTGAATALSSAILFLADHMEIVGGVGTVALVALTAATIKFTSSFWLANAAVLANPFIAGGAMLAGAIVALGIMAQKSEAAAEVWQRLKDIIGSALLLWAKGLQRILGWFNQNITALDSWVSRMQAIAEAGGSVADAIGQDIGSAMASTNASTEEAVDRFAKLRNVGTDAGRDVKASWLDASKTISEMNSELAKNINLQNKARQQVRATYSISTGGSTITASAVSSTPSFNQQIAAERRYADGGPVRGPGGPRSDRIPAMLSAGEYVVNAAATSKHKQLLEAINNSPIRHYAGGGYVAPHDPDNNMYYGQHITKDMFQDQLSVNPKFAQKITAGAQFEKAVLAASSTQFDYAKYFGGSSRYSNLGNSEPIRLTGQWAINRRGATFYPPLIGSGVTADEMRDAGYRKENHPYSRTGGGTGNWRYTGEVSRELVNSVMEQLDTMQSYAKELRAYQKEIAPGVPPDTKVALNKTINKWIKELPNYITDPFKVIPGQARTNPNYGKLGTRFEEVVSQLHQNGMVAGYLSNLSPWSSTLGNYVSYNGPTLPGEIEYGGTLSEDAIKMLTNSFRGAFRNGGSFMVGGSGGPDSQLVSFMASPDERVTVSKGGGGGPVVGQVIIQAADVQSFRQSEDQIASELAAVVFRAAERNGYI